jgi:small subunit ribosomal protein S4
MSRYLGPKLRITRRLGTLPGLTKKLAKRLYRPGQHGKTVNKLTEYGLRLQEKQKLKFNYGLTENQLYRYVKESRRKNGITGLILLQLLEMRLDTICFSLGFSNTIVSARQLVSHSHILVNGKPVNIPSFQCKPNDIITVKNKISIKNLIKSRLESKLALNIPSHLQFDNVKNEGRILDYCSRNDVLINLNELLVIEYYSRR